MILEDAYTASSLLQAAIGAKRDHTDLCVNSCLVILAPKQTGGVVYCGYRPLLRSGSSASAIYFPEALSLTKISSGSFYYFGQPELSLFDERRVR